MLNSFKALDRILRGDATHLNVLKKAGLEVSSSQLVKAGLILGVFYGFCMGWFALFNRDNPELMQVIATMIKVPALFFFTLLVTCPSLYVFNALVGSRLKVRSMMRLLLASIGVTIAVLASLGPIIAFFTVTTTSYPLVVFFNVIAFAISGFLGTAFLRQTLHRLSLVAQDLAVEDFNDTQPPKPIEPATPEASAPPTPTHDLWGSAAPTTEETETPVDESPVAIASTVKPADEEIGEGDLGDDTPDGPLDHPEGSLLGPHVKAVFNIWMVVFALVGAQMGWVLRPFVGTPGADFTWLRAREGDFFSAVWQLIKALLG